MGFAQNLARLQAERGESNYRLAKKLGVHQTTIRNWLDGMKPQQRHLEAIADYFGVPVDDLLKENGVESPTL